MATATATKPRARKVAPDQETAPAPAPAKRTRTKATSAPVAQSKPRGQARRVPSDKEAEILKLAKELGHKWGEIAEKSGVSRNIARLIVLRSANRKPDTPTPDAIMEARDNQKMSWDDILIRFNIRSKGVAQRLYREAGGDTSRSYIGKGGRFLPPDLVEAHRKEREAAQEPKQTKAKKAPAPAKTATEKVTGASAKVAAKAKMGRGKAPKIDLATASDDEVVGALDGRTITVQRSQSLGGGTVDLKVSNAKITALKSGRRGIKFNDDSMKLRTIALSTIVNYR